MVRIIGDALGFSFWQCSAGAANGQYGGGSGAKLQTTGEVPVDVIQMLFSSLDPLLVERKFVGFAGWNMQSKAAVVCGIGRLGE